MARVLLLRTSHAELLPSNTALLVLRFSESRKRSNLRHIFLDKLRPMHPRIAWRDKLQHPTTGTQTHLPTVLEQVVAHVISQKIVDTLFPRFSYHLFLVQERRLHIISHSAMQENKHLSTNSTVRF